MPDGCGGTIECGGCGAGEVCGQVTANVCDVCVPRGCPASAQCGTLSDGCGGTLDCGDCSGSQRCIDNACCEPIQCSDPGTRCDVTDDGCGQPLDCSCAAPLVCDAAGGCCAPITCVDVCMTGPYQGPDGCGGMLTCADCSPPPD